MKTIAQMADLHFRLPTKNQLSLPSWGILYFFYRNKGFLQRKFWRLIWEIAEVSCLSFYLAPSSFKSLYTIALATLFSSAFIDILFKSERALLKQEYRPLSFKNSLLWSISVWSIGLLLISTNILHIMKIESWAALYIAIKCCGILIKNSISAYSLPITSRLRVYFSPLIYPCCIFLLCGISYLLTFIPFYHFMLYLILTLWTLGSLLPELIFLRKIKKSQTKNWYKKFLHGKRINHKTLITNYGPWLLLSTIPFIIQKSWDISLKSYSALAILTFICSFYFIERWTMRPWRSVQLDFFKWEKKIFIANRISLIRTLTFVSAIIAIFIIFLPILNYFQFSSLLKTYLLCEIFLYLGFANWLTEYQTISQEKSSNGNFGMMVYFALSFCSLFAPFILVFIKLIALIALYTFASKKIKYLKNNLNKKSYYLVTLKKSPSFHSSELIWYAEKQCLVISPKDILDFFNYEEIATIKQVKTPQALRAKEISNDIEQVSLNHPYLKKKLSTDTKSYQFIRYGILGSDHNQNIFVRLISSKGLRYFLVPKNQNKLLGKMQQSWFMLE